MASGQTVILVGDIQRAFAKRLIDAAPAGAVINVRQATRTVDQNDLMWALLSDLSRAKPQGRKETPDMWKAIIMKACGHAVQFTMGIDGEPFPVGYRTSKLTKGQMSDLIEFIYAYGAENGVIFNDQRNAA